MIFWTILQIATVRDKSALILDKSRLSLFDKNVFFLMMDPNSEKKFLLYKGINEVSPVPPPSHLGTGLGVGTCFQGLQDETWHVPG